MIPFSLPVHASVRRGLGYRDGEPARDSRRERVSDVERLLTKFETGALLRPTPHVPNIVDLARALAWVAGAGGIDLTANSSRLAAIIGPADHLVVILADGLGMTLVEELPDSAFLATQLVTELRTVFPSSSATVLTALATGEWPNTHGVTGQWTHLPEIRATADLLRFAARTGGRSLAKLGVTVEQVFPLPSLVRSMRRDTLALYPEPVVNSASAAYFSGYRARQGYRTLAEAVDHLIARVGAAEAPTYSYLYTPWIDLEAHRHGVGHPGVRAAVVGLDRALERLATRLNGRARLVLTADHGLLDTPVVARHWLRPGHDIFRGLAFPPSGDARVMYLHVRDGEHDGIRRRFREHYGERFFLISTEEAEQLELFGPGPLTAWVRRRLGDLIVISSGADVLEYVPAGSIDRLMAVTSHHSGLTPAEMRIPLVVA